MNKDEVKERVLSSAKEYIQFLPPQSKRERNLILSYSLLTIGATIILQTLGGAINGGGGSTTLFKVESYTYKHLGWLDDVKQKCNELDQSAEYEEKVGKGWKITSAQPDTRMVDNFRFGGGMKIGECIGTIYVLNK